MRKRKSVVGKYDDYPGTMDDKRKVMCKKWNFDSPERSRIFDKNSGVHKWEKKTIVSVRNRYDYFLGSVKKIFDHV